MTTSHKRKHGSEKETDADCVITTSEKRKREGEQTAAAATADCVICLDTVALASARVGECRHEFCYSCIKEWTTRENTCPFCRERFVWLQKIDRNNGEDVGKARANEEIEIVEERNQQVSREPFRFSDAEPGSLAEQTDLAMQRLLLLVAEQEHRQRSLEQRRQRIHGGRRAALARERAQRRQAAAAAGSMREAANVVDLTAFE